MASEALIRVENVSRTFEVGSQTIHALTDVSFEVEQGEFLALLDHMVASGYAPPGARTSLLVATRPAQLLGMLD